MPSPRRTLALICLYLPFAFSPAACGDDGAATTAETSTSTGPGPASTTVADSTTVSPTTTNTTSADGTGSTGSTSPDGTTAPGTSTDSTATSEDDTTSASTGEPLGTSTGEPGNVVYSAIALPGGLDRIRIHKADLDADRCTWVVLVAPVGGGMYPGLAVPAGWGIESISINDVAAACASDNPFMFGSEPALDASGTIGFGMPGGGAFPCSIDIDASLDFQGLLPGIPPMDDMVANGVAVVGC